MGYSTPTESKLASIYRMLIQGPPNSNKTGSVCQTWPRPLHIQVMPGELGDATIPRGHPDIFPYIWAQDPIEQLTSAAVIAAVEKQTWGILSTPGIETFCPDGCHKLYDYYLDDVSGGQLFRGEKLGSETDPYVGANMYNRARKRFMQYVKRVNASPVKHVVWLCWDGREADDPSKGFKGQSHIFPNLPGAAAKEFMGEFGLVVHSRIQWGLRPPKGRAPAKWQLLPEGDVWGASVKAPIEVIEKLPALCDQDYAILKKLLEDAWQSVASVPAPPTVPAPAGKPA